MTSGSNQFIKDLASRIKRREGSLHEWFDRRRGGRELPLTCSVDIRHSGFKISVIDTNLFPAGFNNLCETFSEKASHAFRFFLQKHHPGTNRVLLIPEEHTRNLFYWENIGALQRILGTAGVECRVASASAKFPSDPTEISLRSGGTLPVWKLSLKGKRLEAKGFEPDLILINNDLTEGCPDYLNDLVQTVLPPPQLGWHSRKKNDHFALYNSLIDEVSQILEIDRWLVSPLTSVETGIDLDDDICRERMASSADRLLEEIARKYGEYGIPHAPYLFAKNNSGTYGLGVSPIHSGKEFREMSSRLKKRLSAAKGGQRVDEILLQEGIPTIDELEGKPLEPVVYLVGGEPVGGFLRLHGGRTHRDNLNVPGMSFSCLCIHKVEQPDEREALLTATFFLGRIAALAAALEFARMEHPLAA